MSSHINIEGSLFIQDTEDGKTSNNIPFEIYSDYSADPINTYFRQLQFSNVTSGSMYMGVSNVGSYFYISEPSASITEQSNTFIITSIGNVGIGKTNPSDSLHVEGETKVSGSLNAEGDLITTNVYTSNVTFGNLVVGGNAYHRIPAGTVALWSNVSNIPAGWAPLSSVLNNLSTRFVRGATTGIGGTSGDNTVDIELDNFPSHTHNINVSNFATGSHGHSLNTNIASTGNNKHKHSVSFATDYSGVHIHERFDYDAYVPSAGYNSKTAYYLEDNAPWRPDAYSINTKTKSFTSYDYHSHSLPYPSGNLNSAAANHAHTIVSPSTNIKLEATGWTHGSNGSTAIAGGNTIETNNSSTSIIPEYKSYVFIVKQ